MSDNSSDDDSVLVTHLFNVSEEEAQAVMEERGEQSCSYGAKNKDVAACAQLPTVQLLLKQPGNAWGESIKSLSACTEHGPILDALIERFSGGSN